MPDVVNRDTTRRNHLPAVEIRLLRDAVIYTCEQVGHVGRLPDENHEIGLISLNFDQCRTRVIRFADVVPQLSETTCDQRSGCRVIIDDENRCQCHKPYL